VREVELYELRGQCVRALPPSSKVESLQPARYTPLLDAYVIVRIRYSLTYVPE
jgi:hypothetical protein